MLYEQRDGRMSEGECYRRRNSEMSSFFCSCRWKAGPHGREPVRIGREGAVGAARHPQVSAILLGL